MPTYGRTSLIDILQWRAIHQPDKLAYRFLADGEFNEVIFTYGELDRRARLIAASLRSYTKAGDRALLLFPPGLDFIAAYFGCLYAKVIAIPAYPPHPARLEKMIPVIRGIVADAMPAVVLLTSALFQVIRSRNEIANGFGNLNWLVTDSDEMDDRADSWQQPEIGGNDIAFLQYTSGSTSTPKGVIVSHSNLMHNLGHIEKSFGQSSKSNAVIWLPPYHDMGLVGGILQPLYTGYPVTLIPHMMFLQQPFRWLQAISRFKATTSGGPNFAYELCIRKIRPAQRELLDLSSWEVAFNGAEQVYHKTLDQFTEYFSPCGFRRDAFLPCYGLAEATLLVTGGPKARTPVIQQLMGLGLEQNQVFISPVNSDATRTQVGCGQIICDKMVKIVDYEILRPCTEGKVGEIWVSGPSVAQGYWNKPYETEMTFCAKLPDSGEGPFMRTGDLGFLHEGELFITGRLKDLVISDGNNHYPHDIERTVEYSHPAIRPGGCAAFSINNSAAEKLVIVAEIEHKPEVKEDEIIMAIRKSVSEHHDIKVHDIRLTLTGGIPRTTSGKIKRYLCKANYLAGTVKKINSL